MMEMVRGIPHVTKREHIRCMVNSQPHPESVVVMIMVRIQFFFQLFINIFIFVIYFYIFKNSQYYFLCFYLGCIVFSNKRTSSHVT